MKKLLTLTFTLFLALTIVGCEKNNENNVTIDTQEESTAESTTKDTNIEFDAKSLVIDYCNGDWDGSFISNDEHCASIEDGVLFIDCKEAEEIPDMGPYEDCCWYSVIEQDENGTWIFDRKLATFELWKNGTRFKKILLDSSYTDLYKLQNCIVTRYGDTLEIIDFDGYNIETYINVVDCYETSDGTIFFSDFDRKNYSISSNGEIQELESSYVRFPRESVEPQKTDTSLVKKAQNLYQSDWDGSCQIIDGNFVAIDYSGNIIINNKLSGHIAFDPDFVVENGSNLYAYDSNAYWLNGSSLISYENGKEISTIDLPDGNARIEWISDSGIIVEIYGDDTSSLYIVYSDGTVRNVSNNVVDCTCAYDTLYYMEGSNVYALDWANPDSRAEVYFEGAYAVSPHTDETEGALVPYEMANYEGYGYSNIYSPYGI